MKRYVVGVLAGSMFLGGCSAELEPNNNHTAEYEVTREALPSQQAVVSTPLPEIQPSVATEPVPEKTAAPKPAKEHLANIAISNCDSNAEYEKGAKSPRDGYSLETDAGKLFWGKDYKPGDVVPMVCKQISVTPGLLAKYLRVTLKKGGENTVVTYDEQISPSVAQSYPQKRPQQYKPLWIDSDIEDGAFVLSPTKGSSAKIDCESKILAEEKICKDGLLTAREILRGLLDESSSLNKATEANTRALFLAQGLPEDAFSAGETVARLNLQGLAEY